MKRLAAPVTWYPSQGSTDRERGLCQTDTEVIPSASDSQTMAPICSPLNQLPRMQEAPGTGHILP